MRHKFLPSSVTVMHSFWQVELLITCLSREVSTDFGSPPVRVLHDDLSCFMLGATSLCQGGGGRGGLDQCWIFWGGVLFPGIVIWSTMKLLVVSSRAMLRPEYQKSSLGPVVEYTVTDHSPVVSRETDMSPPTLFIASTRNPISGFVCCEANIEVSKQSTHFLVQT